MLVAPDSCKRSLEAPEVASRIAAGVRQAIPHCCIAEAPVADGGEGTAAAVRLALGGSWRFVNVHAANGMLVDMPFAACSSEDSGNFAIFDIADVVGLPKAVVAPGGRTTRGVGKAIRAIAERGYKTIVLGLGGSSTSDAGAGMLAESGFRFADIGSHSFHPVFDTLPQIHTISRREDASWLSDIRLIGLTDVTSPLAGPAGASMVFGAQKRFDDLAHADQVLRAFGRKCETLVDAQLAHREGMGAAGGLGFAVCLLGGELRQGGMFIL